jgi:hypothetical protein
MASALTPVHPQPMPSPPSRFHSTGEYVAREMRDGCDVWDNAGDYRGSIPACADWHTLENPPSRSADRRYELIRGRRARVVDVKTGRTIIRLDAPPIACVDQVAWHSADPKLVAACGRSLVAVDVEHRRILDRALLPPGASVRAERGLGFSGVVMFVADGVVQQFGEHELLSWRPGGGAPAPVPVDAYVADGFIVDPVSGSAWGMGSGPGAEVTDSSLLHASNTESPGASRVWTEIDDYAEEEFAFPADEGSPPEAVYVYRRTPHYRYPGVEIGRVDVATGVSTGVHAVTFGDDSRDSLQHGVIPHGGGIVVVEDRYGERARMAVFVAHGGETRPIRTVPKRKDEALKAIEVSDDGRVARITTSERSVRVPLPAPPRSRSTRQRERTKGTDGLQYSVGVDSNHRVWLERSDGAAFRIGDDHWYPEGDAWRGIDERTRFRVGDAFDAPLLRYEQVEKQFRVPGLYARFLRGEEMPERPLPVLVGK